MVVRVADVDAPPPAPASPVLEDPLTKTAPLPPSNPCQVCPAKVVGCESPPKPALKAFQ